MTGLFLILSLIITVGCYFFFRIPVLHAAGIGAASFLAVILCAQIAMYVSTSSTEILNGQVTGKEQNRVSCSHSYSCNCRTVTSGSGKDATTTTVCDTCYEHSNDWDWDVYTTLGTYTIDRVDRRGSNEPERWTIVKAGDPVAKAHSYTNWIKPAGSSLFNAGGNKYDEYKDKLPAYPGDIKDYYNIDRIVGDVKVPNIDQYNRYLSERLRELGPKRQANLIIVATSNLSQTYADALYAAWNGAEKNDIVVVVGVQNNQIKWAKILAWSKADLFQVQLRDSLLDIGTFDMKKIIDTSVAVAFQRYERKPMKEFEYLSNEVQTITPFSGIIIFILIVLINVGGMIYIKNNVDTRSFRF